MSEKLEMKNGAADRHLFWTAVSTRVCWTDTPSLLSRTSRRNVPTTGSLGTIQGFPRPFKAIQGYPNLFKGFWKKIIYFL